MIKDFEYLSPKTLQEALVLLDKHRDECKVIAGGQSLLILMRQGLVAPEYLVDIKGISELNYIQFDAKEGLKIGALTTHRAIEKSPAMKNGFRVLAEMEHRLASIQDFCLDYFETALEPGELLTEIQVPPAPPHTGTAYTKFNIIESDQATVGVAVSITLDSGDGLCQDARIVLGACAPTPRRAKQAEAVLRGKKITDNLLKGAGQTASQEVEPISDISASEEYRRELVKVLVARVGQEALARARQA